MHVLPRIVKFWVICGNDFVKYIATKQNSKCWYMYVDELLRL